VPHFVVLRSTTMLSGVVGWAFLAVTTAWADDPLLTKAPLASVAPSFAPAVDAVNEKMAVLGGTLSSQNLFAVDGSVTAPLGGQYGAQLDGLAGSLGGAGTVGVAGHLFWRDPANALLGLYASENYWDRFGGVDVGHVAIEGEKYWGNFTLQGVMGIEFGNSASSSLTSIGPIITSTVTNSFNVGTRFYDEINLRYYFTDDIDGYIGHRYLGGKNALALGGDVAQPLGSGVLASLFVQAAIGEDKFNGVWGGLKLYFGPSDKPLIARHRQEDPNNWDVDNLFGILNNSSTTSTQSCTIGTGGTGPGGCETPFAPDG